MNTFNFAPAFLEKQDHDGGYSAKGRGKLKVDFNRKYNTIAVYCVLTFAVCLLLVILFVKFSVVAGAVKEFFRVIAPVTWGIVIAYLCNPIMKFVEGKLKKLVDRKKPHPKLTRSLSVAISIILLITILAALMAIIINQIISSIVEIFSSIPEYRRQIEALITKFLGDYPKIVSAIESQLDTIYPKLVDFANDMIPKLGDMSIKLKDSAIVVIVAIKDCVIGFIVAIYLLYSKETFLAQARKIVYAFFPKNLSRNILRVSAKANRTLSGFLSGKLLDSFIIGLICFIVMTIMQMDFTALISVIIGVTNIIPFFGPFIGAIPSALLLLMAAPKQVIPFIIFIVILQQFDGNILGPKIIGDSTGLTPFWVMFSIFVGGGLFGFAGMLLGVPVFAVIYALFSEMVAYLLKKKKLSHRTKDYHDPDAEPRPADNAAKNDAAPQEAPANK